MTSFSISRNSENPGGMNSGKPIPEFRHEFWKTENILENPGRDGFPEFKPPTFSVLWNTENLHAGLPQVEVPIGVYA